jgi:hypothetical protein
MSIGPSSGIAASVAGISLAQTRGAEIERARQDMAAREVRVRSEQKAEMAAGIGQADGDNHETAQRDADGRRLWEFPPPSGPQGAGQEEPPCPQGQDPSGQSGGLLDLSG